MSEKRVKQNKCVGLTVAMLAANWACTLSREQKTPKKGGGNVLPSRNTAKKIPRPCFDRCFLEHNHACGCCFQLKVKKKWVTHINDVPVWMAGKNARVYIQISLRFDFMEGEFWRVIIFLFVELMINPPRLSWYCLSPVSTLGNWIRHYQTIPW